MLTLKYKGATPPVAPLIGACLRGTTHRRAKSLPEELGRICSQSHLDVTQRFKPSQLAVRHEAKVLGAGQGRNPRTRQTSGHDAREACPGHKPNQLSEKRLAKIHEESPKESIWGPYSKNRCRHSNRHQKKPPANPLVIGFLPKSGGVHRTLLREN